MGYIDDLVAKLSSEVDCDLKYIFGTMKLNRVRAAATRNSLAAASAARDAWLQAALLLPELRGISDNERLTMLKPIKSGFEHQQNEVERLESLASEEDSAFSQLSGPELYDRLALHGVTEMTQASSVRHDLTTWATMAGEATQTKDDRPVTISGSEIRNVSWLSTLSAEERGAVVEMVGKSNMKRSTAPSTADSPYCRSSVISRTRAGRERLKSCRSTRCVTNPKGQPFFGATGDDSNATEATLPAALGAYSEEDVHALALFLEKSKTHEAMSRMSTCLAGSASEAP
jgi:hypothetical protein